MGGLVPLLFFGMIGVLFFRWRRRRRATAVTELARRFDGAPLNSHMHPRRRKTNEALPVSKSLFHGRTQLRREGSLWATLPAVEKNGRAQAMFMQAEQALETRDADCSGSARQAQLQLVEENLALRMRIREMEALSIMRSSAPEPDAPPNYDELGVVL